MKIGIIGLGGISSCHLEAIKTFPQLELSAVCDNNPARIESQCFSHNIEIFHDYTLMMRKDIDIIVITLPHDLHFKVARQALNAGKHVLVEKPMCVTPQEGLELIKTARRNGKILAVSEQNIYHPAAAIIKQQYQSGKLGRFLNATVMQLRNYGLEKRPDWGLCPERSGGGMFINVGMHRLAFVRAALPRLVPQSVTASVAKLPGYQVEACTAAFIKNHDGSSIYYRELGYFSRPEWFKEFSEFVFENACIRLQENSLYTIDHLGKETRNVFLQHPIPLQCCYENLLKAIDGTPEVLQIEGFVHDIAIAKAAYQSAINNSTVMLDNLPPARVKANISRQLSAVT